MPQADSTMEYSVVIGTAILVLHLLKRGKLVPLLSNTQRKLVIRTGERTQCHQCDQYSWPPVFHRQPASFADLITTSYTPQDSTTCLAEMSALGVPRALSKATARCIAQVGRSTPVRASLPKAISTPLRTNVAPRRLLSTSPRCPVGLMPETDEPKPKEQTEEVKGLRPTHLKDEEYQLRADECMDAIHEKAEQMQESRNDVEVEFSVRGARWPHHSPLRCFD